MGVGGSALTTYCVMFLLGYYCVSVMSWFEMKVGWVDRIGWVKWVGWGGLGVYP